jgi:hypothetical protein
MSDKGHHLSKLSHPALVASGLAIPARRITANLAPADLPRKAAKGPRVWFNVGADSVRRAHLLVRLRDCPVGPGGDIVLAVPKLSPLALFTCRREP